MPNISGVVLEQFSNRPLNGVVVDVDGTSTVTGGSGRFFLFVSDTGTVNIGASLEGYDGFSTFMDLSVQNNITIHLAPIFGFL